MSIEANEVAIASQSTPPASSVPVLRREAILVHQERGRVATLVAVCSLLGVALGFALSTMAALLHGPYPAPAAISVRVVPSMEVTTLTDWAPTWLGVNIVSETDQSGGAHVVRVLPGSPAARAGVAVDDIILAVSGMPIHTSDDLVSLVRGEPVGSAVVIQLRRDGVERRIQATLGRMPTWVLEKIRD
jgi:predicted metalloprotease with PDZ domain